MEGAPRSVECKHFTSNSQEDKLIWPAVNHPSLLLQSTKTIFNGDVNRPLDTWVWLVNCSGKLALKKLHGKQKQCITPLGLWVFKQRAQKEDSLLTDT